MGGSYDTHCGVGAGIRQADAEGPYTQPNCPMQSLPLIYLSLPALAIFPHSTASDTLSSLALK